MNRITFFFLIVTFLSSSNSIGQSKIYTLNEIIETAKEQSPFIKQAETKKENRYWSYRFYKSNFNPQLRLDGNIPRYSNAFINVTQGDGTLKFQSVNQLRSELNLGLEQPLLWTGGNISINSNLFYFDILGDNISNELWRGSPFNIRLDQPLFGFNTLKWDKKTRPLQYEESKRQYVEELEEISGICVSRFFNFMSAQINLQIAQFNLSNNDTIFFIEQGRFNIGKTSKEKLLQAELQLLRSKEDVAKARLELETTRLRLRSYIGLDPNEEFELVLPESIPQFELNYDDALSYGQKNRADYLAFKRRKLEAAREVAQAKTRRFETQMTVTFGLNDSGPNVNDVYSDPLNEQRFNVGFGIPLMTWGRNEARMQTAVANQRLQEYIVAQDEQNFEQEILTQVRQFDVLRIQLDITKKSDEVAQERYEVAQKRYLIGKIDITNLNIALTEKDKAKRSYIGALREFWTAYYKLRQLTLYDFVENRLLYNEKK